MQWHRIAIHSHEADIAQQSATALIERILKVYRDAHAPGGFEVWHRRSTPMDYEYYLSPKASEFLLRELSGYRPAPCDKPDLLTLRQVPL